MDRSGAVIDRNDAQAAKGTVASLSSQMTDGGTVTLGQFRAEVGRGVLPPAPER